MVGGLTPASDDGTWRYAWPAGTRMLTELDLLCVPCGATVVDLGCGGGRLGRWALERGAAQVVFADQSMEALDTVMTALAGQRDRAVALRHVWGEPLPPARLVLGGDILYRPNLFPALFASLRSALCEGGTALLGDPRVTLEPELPELAGRHGLQWSTERRATGYTLCTIGVLRT